MKRLLIFLSTVVLSLSSFGQTAQQLKMIQQMSPDQIEQLKKSQLKSNNEAPKNTPSQSISTSREEVIIDEDINKTTFDSTKVIDRTKLVYGHEIFSKQNLTFAPSLNLPTPKSYVLGSGDELNINVWGAAEASYKAVVSPDGYIDLSGIGLINVNGITINEADKRIKAELARRYEGSNDGAININVSLGKIRTITVNIAGEAKVPGTYSLPSLATLFNALYVAGGVSEIGSVREINLYRAGKKINTLDVYEYLMNGDINVNVRLQDNDLIVIEPYLNIVTVEGPVKRPMKYEMKSNESLSSLLKYAGGFTGNAFIGNIAVSRSADGKQLQMYSVDKAGYEYFMMRDNDVAKIGEISQRYANRIAIGGEVWNAGYYELKKDISTIKDLITQAGGVTPYTYMGRALLYRLNEGGDREINAVNLTDILNGTDTDITLRANDSLAVFAKEFFYEQQNVVVRGEVNFADTLVYGAGMTLYDAIVACGGLKTSASQAVMEISRRVTDPNATQAPDRAAQVFSFKVNPDLSLSPNVEQFQLMPFDEIFIRKSPGYLTQMNVTIQGEISFDGQYTLEKRISRLSDLVERAGGVTKDAYVKGAFMRRQKTIYDIEREKSLDILKSNSTGRDTVLANQGGVGDYYAVAINLDEALNDINSFSNIELKDGDVIVIPIKNNTVKISGAVYFPNTVTYIPGKKLNDYIESAGGYSDRAKRKPFVIYPNGMVVKKGKIIEPGSEIIIPFKPYKEPMKASEWISLSSSVISMAAMVTSLFR